MATGSEDTRAVGYTLIFLCNSFSSSDGKHFKWENNLFISRCPLNFESLRFEPPSMILSRSWSNEILMLVSPHLYSNLFFLQRRRRGDGDNYSSRLPSRKFKYDKLPRRWLDDSAGPYRLCSSNRSPRLDRVSSLLVDKSFFIIVRSHLEIHRTIYRSLQKVCFRRIWCFSRISSLQDPSSSRSSFSLDPQSKGTRNFHSPDQPPANEFPLLESCWISRSHHVDCKINNTLKRLFRGTCI